MAKIAQAVAYFIYPLALPGWAIERLLSKNHPGWHFSVQSAPFYFAPVVIASTIACLYGNRWVQLIGLYYIFACYLVALWLTLAIAFIRPGRLLMLLRIFGKRGPLNVSTAHLLKPTMFLASLIAYLYFIYGFGVTALVIQRNDPTAFHGITAITPLSSLFEFLYFSLITMATVGFGDIYPVTPLARLVTMVHIVLSIYVTFFLLGAFVSFRVNMLTSDSLKNE